MVPWRFLCFALSKWYGKDISAPVIGHLGKTMMAADGSSAQAYIDR